MCLLMQEWKQMVRTNNLCIWSHLDVRSGPWLLLSLFNWSCINKCLSLVSRMSDPSWSRAITRSIMINIILSLPFAVLFSNCIHEVVDINLGICHQVPVEIAPLGHYFLIEDFLCLRTCIGVSCHVAIIKLFKILIRSVMKLRTDLLRLVLLSQLHDWNRSVTLVKIGRGTFHHLVVVEGNLDAFTLVWREAKALPPCCCIFFLPHAHLPTIVKGASRRIGRQPASLLSYTLSTSLNCHVAWWIAATFSRPHPRCFSMKKRLAITYCTVVNSCIKVRSGRQIHCFVHLTVHIFIFMPWWFHHHVWDKTTDSVAIILTESFVAF